MNSHIILVGDVMKRLAGLPSGSVHVVVTSPPYWGLRDYGVPGQIGLEPTVAEHLRVMVAIFAEIHRVLRDDGTCWVNYGDCYATAANGRSAADQKAAGTDNRAFTDKPFGTVDKTAGLKAKDLVMMPNRLALALQVWNCPDPSAAMAISRAIDKIHHAYQGRFKPKRALAVLAALENQQNAGGVGRWYVRDEIIWHKPNPMPSSVGDRFCPSHEKVFLITKNPQYYFDDTECREKTAWDATKTKMPDGWDTGPGAHGSIHRSGREKGKKVSGRNSFKRDSSKRAVAHPGQIMGTHRPDRPDVDTCADGTRKKRNVITVATKAFQVEMCGTCKKVYMGPDRKKIRTVKENLEDGTTREDKICECGAENSFLSHFATFPPDLIVDFIRAGTSSRGVCDSCGAQWRRVVDVEYSESRGRTEKSTGHQFEGSKGITPKTKEIKTTGWAAGCDCGADIIPATVLDPFGGAGTTSLVADREQRNSIMIELNSDYAELARVRIKSDGGAMFKNVKLEMIDE